MLRKNRFDRGCPILVLCATLAPALVACQSTSGRVAPRTVVDAPLTSTEWECRSIEAHPMPEVPRPTLTLSLPDRANGFAGINRYFGTVDFDRESMRFPRIGATRMAGPPERMELERAFLGALERTRTFRLSGNELTLLGEGGTVTATFAAMPTDAELTPATR